MKHKAGDKVVITKAFNHGFSVGEVVELVEIYQEGKEGEHWKAKSENDYWWIYETEFKPYKTNQMKEFKVQVPDGYEIDKEKSTFESIVFKKKCGLPESWDELGKISGAYVNSGSRIKLDKDLINQSGNRNVFATEEQAEASVALAQLTQLLKAYNGDWKPDWNTIEQKHVISLSNHIWQKDWYNGMGHLFAFETVEKRDHFLRHHIDLLNKVKPLYGG